MLIQNLRIRNFRCFKDFGIEFGKKSTVIFGKNGSGKTTLIHALHKALSFIMFSDKTYESVKVGNKRKRKIVDIRTIANNNPYLKVEGFNRVGDYNNHEDHTIDIEATASLDSNKNLHWSMSAFATNNRIRPSEFIEAFREFYFWHNETGNLPVLAYYSDCFPHREDTKKSTNIQKVEKLRNFGYFDWNAIEGCSKIWILRLESDLFNIRQNKDKLNKLENAEKDQNDNSNSKLIESIEQNITRWQLEVDAIEKCLIAFTKDLLLSDEDVIEIGAIDIHSEEGRLCINTTSGKEISFVNLPSGYKRLLNIVLDLAFRSYILSDKQTTNSSGIAIIDEIDLHLHPELENVVLDRFMKVFPNIQFIVSTHSINVLTSVKTVDGLSKVLMMSPNADAPTYFNDIYGIGASSGQQEIMGVKINDEDLKRYISQCAFMYQHGLTEQANRLKDFIIKKKLISQVNLECRIRHNIDQIS